MVPILAFTWIDLGVMNDVLFQFEAASSSWVLALQPLALTTFASLAALELAWTGIRSAIQPQGSLERVFELLFRKAVFLGFVYWLIDVSPALMPLIIGSFQRAGAIASGIDSLHPSSFLATGVSVASNYLSQVNELGLVLDPLGVFMAASGALVTVVVFATMSAMMLLTLVEAMLAIGAVPFLFAAAGSRWTAALAEGALAYVVRVGVKLFLVYLLGAVVNNVTIEWAERVNAAGPVGPITYLGFLGSSWALAVLLWSIPRHAANMVPPSLRFGLSPAVGDN